MSKSPKLINDDLHSQKKEKKTNLIKKITLLTYLLASNKESLWLCLPMYELF
jgi:hypothetical protein